MNDKFEIENALGISKVNNRPENIRDSQNELKRIKQISDENIKIIRNSLTSSSQEDNRNAIVNLIACLDYYTREIVLWGVLAITQDKFEKGKEFDKFEISIKFLKEAFDKNNAKQIDKEELRKQILDKLKSSKYTFQKWDSIKDGLKIILPKNSEEKIGQLTTNKNQTGKAIFQTKDLQDLNNIRNNIVHHFDRDYTDNSKRFERNIDIEKEIKLIETIIDSIHEIIEKYELSASESST